jgi:hypothetical protein
MENYSQAQKDTAAGHDTLREFSRLFAPTEAAQLAQLAALGEKAAQATLQKRMIDESLWTRNRVKTKAWLDVGYGIHTMTNPDGGAPMAGSAMSLAAGYDFQMGRGMIVGVNAGMTMTENTEGTNLDIGYGLGASAHIAGARNVKSADTMINIGAYVISRIADSATAYVSANAFSHKLSVDRTQNYVGAIAGEGTASSMGGEIGIIHSISGQYVVGNLSARLVQSGGYTLQESVGSEKYMDIKYEGYTLFSPGYSILFQKRIYLKPTFIMRPSLSVGAEYDVMNMGGSAQYRFATSEAYSAFDMKTDPLWLSGKAGLEFLTIGGLQFGAGYAYRYNAVIQSHDLQVSGSMRF